MPSLSFAWSKASSLAVLLHRFGALNMLRMAPVISDGQTFTTKGGTSCSRSFSSLGSAHSSEEFRHIVFLTLFLLARDTWQN